MQLIICIELHSFWLMIFDKQQLSQLSIHTKNIVKLDGYWWRLITYEHPYNDWLMKHHQYHGNK